MEFEYRAEDFKEAKPINGFLKMALAGPNNSGKTVSALRIAAGLGGETAVIDSENKRALKYSEHFKFKHFNLEPPFSSENYQAATEAAVKAGFNNIISDSMSHEHEGPGGMLDQVEEFLQKKCGDDEKKRDKFKMSAFIAPKQARTRFIQFGIQRVNANVILCFRAKNKTVMKKQKWVSDDGLRSGEKTVVEDAGLQPIGGEEYWYEMEIVAMLREKSGGCPAWDETSSRINEFPLGKLTEYLHSVKQFNEETGRKLKEFYTVVAEGKFIVQTSKITTKHVTPEEWKTRALDVIGKLQTVDHCQSFLGLNNPNILAVQAVDPDAASDVISAAVAKETAIKERSST